MSYQFQIINPQVLGSYAPKLNPDFHAKKEAENALNQGIWKYKNLYYGLQHLIYNFSEYKDVFQEAVSFGELVEFKLAPGSRALKSLSIPWESPNSVALRLALSAR